MATDAVFADSCTKPKCDALSTWLLQHPGPALITSLQVTGAHVFSFIHQHRLMVPAHLLQGLQRLKLERINLHTTTLTTATAAGPAIPAAAAAYAMSPSDEEQQHQDLLQQLAALTGLTSLSLHNCCINLASLSALTGLRDLDCSSTQAYEPTKAATSSSSSSSKEKSSSSIPNPADVAQALPHLEHLTGLSLSEKLCCDVTLAATSSLQRLQRLCLEDKGNLSSKAFAVLPLTLTLLELSCTWDIDYNIGPVETPGIAQLTALQSLSVRQHCTFNTDVLEAMHQLRHMTLHDVKLTAQPGRPRTRHLANMPQLQHLELPMYEEFYDDWQTWQHEFAQPLTLRTAEAPFLASSSQLTHLSLGHDFGSMDAACYSLMFTPRSCLPHLLVLEVGIQLLCNPAAVLHLKVAAPQLQALSCRDYKDTAHLFDADIITASLAALVSVTSLQQLDLDDDADHALVLDSAAWGMMAALTGLRELRVRVQRHSLYEVLQLTALKQLTCLSVGVTGTDEWQEKDGEQTLLLFSQAPRGSLPVWKQIPSPLARMAMDTMMYLQERYPEVLDIDSNDDSDDYGDEYNAELEEGFNKLETYTNMLTRVSAGIETLTFKPPGINTRAGKRGGGFAANNEMEAAARAWARKWLVKPGSKGASKQRQRKVAEQRTQPSQPQNPRRQNLQQPQYPQAPHMSVGAWGWWGRVIRLLLSLVPLWLVCWCQQMQAWVLDKRRKVE